MVAPLCDSRGVLRYYIGAQVDISGLAKECSNLEGLQQLLQETGELEGHEEDEKKDEFRELSEMFNQAELETARKYGGRMHRELQDADDGASIRQRPRVLIKDHTLSNAEPTSINSPASAPTYGKLSGVYQNVSLHFLHILGQPLNQVRCRVVYAGPTVSVLEDPLRFPFIACARSASITLHGSHRK